jgi:hypothetical protein
LASSAEESGEGDDLLGIVILMEPLLEMLTLGGDIMSDVDVEIFRCRLGPILILLYCTPAVEDFLKDTYL